MRTPDAALSDLERAQVALAASDEALRMDEEAFRIFYERTARPLWGYLSRASGDAALADDLVQESYVRLLGARLHATDEDYLKNYLFRIGSNLLRDHWRRERCAHGGSGLPVGDPPEPRAGSDVATEVQQRSDLAVTLSALTPRERQLLWLAYVEGSSHREIASLAGLREGSVRLLLFRARRRLAGLLRTAGLHP